jgi:hypothetical protein
MVVEYQWLSDVNGWNMLMVRLCQWLEYVTG